MESDKILAEIKECLFGACVLYDELFTHCMSQLKCDDCPIYDSRKECTVGVLFKHYQAWKDVVKRL